MSERDRLVSTAVLRERRDRLRQQIAEQKRIRSSDDPFFKHTEWMLEEWESAERDAAREYVPTSRASELTGWSPQTLRKYAAAARAGEALPEGWTSCSHGVRARTGCSASRRSP
jgi:hypothetical protein